MVSGLIGNEVPRKGLRVRAPCPPLKPVLFERVFLFLDFKSVFLFLRRNEPSFKNKGGVTLARRLAKGRKRRVSGKKSSAAFCETFETARAKIFTLFSCAKNERI